MSKRTRGHLFGSLRLIRGDTIGVPIFSSPGRNQLFVPETDMDLRIVDFLDFYNEHEYEICRDVHKNRKENYEIGDAVPIPFWIAGCPHLARGDMTSAELEAGFETLPAFPDVVKDLARILLNARSGHYQQLNAERQAEALEARFSDVFTPPPIHSKYWISRYRVALANARSLAKTPHPIDIKLKGAAIAWFDRFGSKTKPKNLVAMLGDPSDGVFSVDEERDIYFAFLAHMLARKKTQYMEQLARTPRFGEMFPRGLYLHYLSHGYPEVPFKYERPKDFTALFRDELYEGQRSGQFQRAHRVAALLFGKSDLPDDLSHVAGGFLRDRLDHFDKGVDWAFDHLFKNRSRSEEWKDAARGLLAEYDALHRLDAVMHGYVRDRPVAADGRFAIQGDLIRELERYAQTPHVR